MKKSIRSILNLILTALLIVTAFPLYGSVSAEEADISAADIDCVARPVKDGAYTVSAEKYNAYESEHFQILWGDKNNAAITEKWLEGNCKILEGCWDLYVGELGMNPPSLCTRKNGDQKTHYKVNVIIMGTGIAGYESGWAYGGIDTQGYAYLMCDQGAMVYAPQTWVTPHEFGHCTQFAQGYNSWANSDYLGPWYEAMANWFREQYLYSDYYTSNQYYRTDFSHLYLRSISLTAANGRAYYEAWPILQYLTENPDNLPGYGSDFVSKLLENGSSTGYIYNMIEKLADAELSDTLGYFAAHMATFDLSQQKNYQAKIKSLVSYGDFYWQQFYTMLEPVAGAKDTYAVPSDRAPQQAAYVITPLEITGDTISVTLNGSTSVKGAGWRACIVLVRDGEETYSELFGDGETMTAKVDGATEAYLTVAATPDLETYKKYSIGGWTTSSTETNLSFNKKQRYPYEAVITGAEPQARVIDTTVKGEAHVNGGGFVSSKARVDDSVYVGPDAMVLDNARIQGNVRIDGHAIVMGTATLKDNVIVDGYATVGGTARLTGNAHVGENAVVAGKAAVSDNAQVLGSAYVTGSFKLSDNAIAKGLALCIGSGQITGQGVADGDLFEDGSNKFDYGTAAGYLSLNDATYKKRLKYTEGMYLGYEFGESYGGITNEMYSSTYARVHDALWEESDTGNGAKGIYTFDGKSQYLELDGMAISSRDVQIQLRALWDGGSSAQQKLFYAGDDGNYMYFTPSDESGKASFVIADGDDKLTLTSYSAMPEGEWCDVTVTFADGKAALTINGETVAAADTAALPSALSAQSFIIGAGLAGGVCSDYYSGSVDSAKFFFNNAAGVSFEAVEAPDTEPEETSAEPSESDSNGSDSENNNENEQSDNNGNTGIIIAVAVTVTIALVLVLVLVLTSSKKNSKKNDKK